MSYLDPAIYCPHNIRDKEQKQFVMGMLYFAQNRKPKVFIREDLPDEEKERIYNETKEYCPLEKAADFIAGDLDFDGDGLEDKMKREFLDKIMECLRHWIQMEALEMCVGIIDGEWDGSNYAKPFTDMNAADGPIFEPSYRCPEVSE